MTTSVLLLPQTPPVGPLRLSLIVRLHGGPYRAHAGASGSLVQGDAKACTKRVTRAFTMLNDPATMPVQLFIAHFYLNWI